MAATGIFPVKTPVAHGGTSRHWFSAGWAVPGAVLSISLVRAPSVSRAGGASFTKGGELAAATLAALPRPLAGAAPGAAALCSLCLVALHGMSAALNSTLLGAEAAISMCLLEPCVISMCLLHVSLGRSLVTWERAGPRRSVSLARGSASDCRTRDLWVLTLSPPAGALNGRSGLCPLPWAALSLAVGVSSHPVLTSSQLKMQGTPQGLPCRLSLLWVPRPPPEGP